MQMNGGQGIVLPENSNNRQFSHVNQPQVYFYKLNFVISLLVYNKLRDDDDMLSLLAYSCLLKMTKPCGRL